MTTTKKMAVHQKVFSIEWGDMDALGHVNNGRYFDYFQQARIEWLESINLGLQQGQGTGPVVIHVGCTFLKPIIYPATLKLTSSLHSLGRSSMVIDHDIYQDDELMTQGTSKIVWVDYNKNQSVPLPESLRQLIEPLV